MSVEIRTSQRGDHAAIEQLYPDAFPDEDLLPLVRELLQAEQMRLSLVGLINSQLVGHVMFTTCCSLADEDASMSLLGPLAVASRAQGNGYGSALVREGWRRLKDKRCAQVFVLGDPGFYARFGFEPERQVDPPYPLPSEWIEAWQSIRLEDDPVIRRGKLVVPQPWRQPALWSS